MQFDPITLARTWLPVSVAASRDAARPQLCNTIHVEEHDTGFRVVATDSYILLHGFAANRATLADNPDGDEPPVDAEPVSTATIIDTDRRCAGLLAYAYKLATAKGADPDDYPVTIDLDVADPYSAGAFEGMGARRAQIRVHGESLTLPIYEGAYPNWPKIAANQAAISSLRIALNPDRLKQLVKASSFTPNLGLGWSFTGPNSAAMVELIDSNPFISGVVMPVRWDLDTNTPVTAENDDGEPVPTDEQAAWDEIMRRYYTDPDNNGEEGSA